MKSAVLVTGLLLCLAILASARRVSLAGKCLCRKSQLWMANGGCAAAALRCSSSAVGRLLLLPLRRSYGQSRSRCQGQSWSSWRHRQGHSRCQGQGHLHRRTGQCQCQSLCNSWRRWWWWKERWKTRMQWGAVQGYQSAPLAWCFVDTAGMLPTTSPLQGCLDA